MQHIDKDSNMSRINWPLVGACVVMVALLAFLYSVKFAVAQHVHPDETITDERVAKFYDTWKRPPERLVSCCNREDCYDAQIRRGPNGLEYLHKWSGTWAALPESVIESNQPDPHDSPNTTNHVCANKHDPRYVYCAVLGAGL
jgi:hypothetical protein